MKSFFLIWQVLVFFFFLLPLKIWAQTFTDSGISFPQEYSSAAEWGDYNNDGYLDLLLFENYVPSIYKNNGNNTFTKQAGISYEGDAFGGTWGDYDNDGDLDILLNGMASSGTIYFYYTRIYKNNGNNTFTEQTDISLKGASLTSAWGDYNNDGFLDILLSGATKVGSTFFVTTIYKNNGNNTFSEQINFSLTGIGGSVDWIDYDNDGDLDISLFGYDELFGPVSKIYKNNGSNCFSEQTNIMLPGLSLICFDWGDYDNDGDLDLFLAGHEGYNGDDLIVTSKIYQNNGNGTFTEQTGMSLTGVDYGSVAWGDYDNDGDLDILLTGRADDYPTLKLVSKLYRNNGNNIFTEQTDIILPGVESGTAVWGDYDNDGDLDIFVTGIVDYSGNPICKIYKNNCPIANKNPANPQNLIYEIQKKDVILKWNKINSDETSSKSITYNFRIGREVGGSNFLSPHSASTGFRRIIAMGNAQLDTFFLFKNLRWDTTYYASVQGIDNCFKGGLFSNTVQFKTSPIQPSDLNAVHISSTSLLLKWKRGNGDRCIVFAKEGTTGLFNPQNYTTYYYNTVFGESIPIGTSGWYCIYKGDADSVLLSGLDQSKTYVIHAIEFQNQNGSEIYAPTLTSENIGVFSTKLFSFQSGISLINVKNSSVAWGDFDNDGDLDILLTGEDINYNRYSTIYSNNGDNTFVEYTNPHTLLTGVSNGSITWGDYDIDGDLDILLTGHSQSSPYYITKIYRNDNHWNYGNIFPEQTDILIEGSGQAFWGDYDNDGDLDILFLGGSLKVYRNDRNNTFVELPNFTVTGTLNSSAWGDYDNDGDLDILLSVHTGAGPYYEIVKIYSNVGNDTFIEQTNTSLLGVRGIKSYPWGDYDNDGNQDLVLIGRDSNYNRTTKIFRNNGDKTFTEQTSIKLPGIEYGYIVWGDYNNDGNLDILLTGEYSGYTGAFPISKIFCNNGNNSFTEQTDITLTGVSNASAAWGDYDNDGDLDIILIGIERDGTFSTRIYRNNLIMKASTFTSNTIPCAPIDLKSTITPDNIKLFWSAITNDETPFNTMSYNLRYKLKNSINWLYAPHAADDGFRRLVSIGNVQFNNYFYPKNLLSGIYYWQVQAVDQGYMGGAWSAVDSFEVRNVQAFFKTDTVCFGLPTHFTDQSVATDGIAAWKWDFKDGTISTAQNPVHTYSASGTFNVKLVITDNTGVKDSLEQIVIVRPKPLTGFSAPAVCQGIPVTATNSTNNNGLTISSWKWNFGDGGTSTDQQPPPHPYLNPGDYTIKLKAVASNGCADSVTHVASVGAYPVAAVTANAPLTFCKGDSVTLSVPYNSSYNYDWMAGEVSLTGGDSSGYTPKLSGSYSVRVVNPKGNCTSTSSSVVITALDAPAAPLITTEGATLFCEGDSVALSVTNTAGYTFQWKLNGGAVGANSYRHVVKNGGTYSLTVSNSSGCSVNSTNKIDVTVNASPAKPAIDKSGPTTFCEGGSVTLSVPSVAGNTYKWKNETGVIPGADASSYTALTSGNYSLRVTNSTGCFSETTPVSITVKPSPSKPVITTSGYSPGECLGVNPIRLEAGSAVPGYRYRWIKDGELKINDTLTHIEFYEKGIYKLRAELGDCPAESDAVTITLPDAPDKPIVYVKGPVVWYMAAYSKTATKYQWYRNDELIQGATKYIYVANKTLGTYKVAVGNQNECYTMSDPKTIPLSKGEMTDFYIPPEYLVKGEEDPYANLQIYPNPSTGIFTIVFENDILGELTIGLITEQGKEIRTINTQKTTQLYKTEADFSSQSKGVYFIYLKLDKYTATRKIIVE